MAGKNSPILNHCRLYPDCPRCRHEPQQLRGVHQPPFDVQHQDEGHLRPRRPHGTGGPRRGTPRQRQVPEPAGDRRRLGQHPRRVGDQVRHRNGRGCRCQHHVQVRDDARHQVLGNHLHQPHRSFSRS